MSTPDPQESQQSTQTQDPAAASVPAQYSPVRPSAAPQVDGLQSPVDIAVSALGPADGVDPLVLELTSTHWRVFDTGTTIEAEPVTEDGEAAPGGAGGFTAAGTRYDVVQFHLHAPSEHTFDGATTDLEVHVVAKETDTGRTAVVGLPMTIGDDSSALAPVFGSIPTVRIAREGVVLRDELDLTDLLPAGAETARFDGSLTTPPYTEGLLWTVYLAPVSVSAREANFFTAVYDGNVRPVQPLLDRPMTARTVVSG